MTPEENGDKPLYAVGNVLAEYDLGCIFQVGMDGMSIAGDTGDQYVILLSFG